jgi:hypothetical protein
MGASGRFYFVPYQPDTEYTEKEVGSTQFLITLHNSSRKKRALNQQESCYEQRPIG